MLACTCAGACLRKPQQWVLTATFIAVVAVIWYDDVAAAMAAAIEETRRRPGLLNVTAIAHHDGGSPRTHAMSPPISQAPVGHPQAVTDRTRTWMRPEVSVKDTVRSLLQVNLSMFSFSSDDESARRFATSETTSCRTCRTSTHYSSWAYVAEDHAKPLVLRSVALEVRGIDVSLQMIYSVVSMRSSPWLEATDLSIGRR